MPNYPIELSDNTIRQSIYFEEGVDIELDIHNTNVQNNNGLNVKFKNNDLTITQKSGRYDTASQTYITTYSIKSKYPGIPISKIEDELTISRSGFTTSTIKIDMTLNPKAPYPILLSDKTIRRHGTKEQLKFSLWLARKNSLNSISTEVASGKKYVQEKLKGSVIVSGGKEYRKHDFEIVDTMNAKRAVIKDRLKIIENGKEIDEIFLNLTLIEETPPKKEDLSFSSTPVSGSIPMLDEKNEPGKGNVSINRTPDFDFSDVTKIKFGCVYDSSDPERYSDTKTTLREVTYIPNFDGDESKLLVNDVNVGKDEYIPKYIGPDNNRTFNIGIIPRVIGMKCIKITVESLNRHYNPIYYWYEVTSYLLPDETVPESDRADFQPQIVAYDGLMGETRLHPSQPIRKSETLKRDIPDIGKADVDMHGRLVMLEVKDVVNIIKQKIGENSSADGSVTKPPFKLLPSNKVPDWSTTATTVFQPKNP